MKPSESFHCWFPWREVIYYATLAYHTRQLGQAHTHTHAPHIRTMRYLFLTDLQKPCCIFSTMPYLAFRMFIVDVCCRVCSCRRFQWCWHLKGDRSIAMGWGGAWLLYSRTSFIIQADLSVREHHSKRCRVVKGPCGHPQSKTELSRELDMWTWSHFLLQHLFHATLAQHSEVFIAPLAGCDWKGQFPATLEEKTG